MQFSTLAVLSFLSIITSTAHPLSSESRNPNAGDAYVRNYRTRSPRDLEARDASPFNMDDIEQGAQHKVDHVKHAAHNQTAAVTEQAHKYAPAAKKYEPGAEMAICAVGAFMPVVDIAIDSACLGLVAAKGGHALYKHEHNRTDTATHTAKHSEPSYTLDLPHHSHSPLPLDPPHHPDPSQALGPPQHSEPPQHSGAPQHKRDR
ncbi:hypothetical protein MMC30_004523 [Trapelia coarctata]|nr:hypothetical protein [Trapelia coarctata]